MYEGADLLASPAELLERESGGALEFVPLQAEHLLALEPKKSQRTQYGIPVSDIGWSEADAMAAEFCSWTAFLHGRVAACMGIRETFPGMQGVAWAFFAEGLGRAMVPITKFAREAIIGTSDLQRIEAIVRCCAMPAWLDEEPSSEIRATISVAYASKWATPEVRWARKVGLEPVAVLRKFGAAGETHMLLEKTA